MTETTNYDLKKIDGTDNWREIFDDHNDSMDIIDTTLASQNADIANTQSGIAYIVGDTNTTGSTLSAGQFVFVKGHASIAEGLRKVTASISPNGSITTSNTTAVSGGGLNALNSKIVNLSTVTSESFTAIPTGQSTEYTTKQVNVSKTGYIPISAGFTCNQKAINVFTMRLIGNTVTVGASGLSSASTVTIDVVYLKSP